MRISQAPANTAIISTIVFPFLAAAVGNLDCSHIVVDKVSWDLSKLGGPKSVLNSEDKTASFRNTTYTIDLCKPLKRVSFDKIPAAEQCPGGTWVCGIERVINKQDKQDTFVEATPIAGNLKDFGGGSLDAKWLRLQSSKSKADSEKEGLRLTIGGGFRTDPETKVKRLQQAVVEFICDENLKGDENLWDPEDKYDDGKSKRAESGNSSLSYLGYDNKGENEDVLFLEWRTRYACEGSKKEQDALKGEHWGFFTWFIIIAFLSTATYLIFGSWLNYNRYGARGWDLLPHGDTIRDVPYLAKDWSRRVLNTMQGGGSRGGYAAV